MPAILRRWVDIGEDPIRRFLAGLFIIVGVLAASVAVISYTLKTVFYEEDRYVEVFDDLAVDDSLRERVADGLTERLLIVANSSQEGRLGDLGTLEELGIEIEGIDETDEEAFAQAIEAEQESVIHAAAEDVVNDAAFAQIFENAVRESHDELLEAFADDSEIITNRTGVVTVDLNRLIPAVQNRIAGELVTAELAQTTIPTIAGRFKVLDKTVGFDRMWTLFRSAEAWSSRMIILSFVSLALALVVGDRRPWALITYGTAVASVAGVVIVVLFVVWALIPLLVDIGETSGLVSAVYRRAISPFVRNEILAGLGAVGIALTGYVARLIWPDDWVYEHHDAGAGPVAVRTSAGNQGYPQQQYPQQPYPPMYPQYPQQQYPQQQYPQQQYPPQQYPQQQYPQPYPPQPTQAYPQYPQQLGAPQSYPPGAQPPGYGAPFPGSQPQVGPGPAPFDNGSAPFASDPAQQPLPPPPPGDGQPEVKEGDLADLLPAEAQFDQGVNGNHLDDASPVDDEPADEGAADDSEDADSDDGQPIEVEAVAEVTKSAKVTNARKAKNSGPVVAVNGEEDPGVSTDN